MIHDHYGLRASAVTRTAEATWVQWIHWTQFELQQVILTMSVFLNVAAMRLTDLIFAWMCTWTGVPGEGAGESGLTSYAGKYNDDMWRQRKQMSSSRWKKIKVNEYVCWIWIYMYTYINIYKLLPARPICILTAPRFVLFWTDISQFGCYGPKCSHYCWYHCALHSPHSL